MGGMDQGPEEKGMDEDEKREKAMGKATQGVSKATKSKGMRPSETAREWMRKESEQGHVHASMSSLKKQGSNCKCKVLEANVCICRHAEAG